MVRQQFYRLLKNYDKVNIALYDIFKVSWSDFYFPSGFTIHYVTDAESDRPYLISLRYYNSVEYIDFLLLVNQVSNFLELKKGTQLKIPALTDIEEFKVRQFIKFQDQVNNGLP